MADLKYSFVDLDYTYTDFDNDKVENGHGARGEVSISPYDNFFIIGGLAMAQADSDRDNLDLETTRIHLGMGGYVEVIEYFHLTGHAGVVYSEVDSDLRSLQNDEFGVYAKPGVRMLPLDLLELNADMTFSTVDNEEFKVGLGAGLNIIENFQVNTGVELADQANIWSAGFRVQW